MVKTFHVELDRNAYGAYDDSVVRFVLVKLAEALKKMPNLVDLRIIHSRTEELSYGRISRVIRFVFNRWQS